jgi:hypothetical protein
MVAFCERAGKNPKKKKITTSTVAVKIFFIDKIVKFS